MTFAPIARLIIALCFLASCNAVAKQPEISLAELVEAADVIFLGHVKNQTVTNEKSTQSASLVRNEIAVSRTLKGSIHHGRSAAICYFDDDNDPPNLSQHATYIFFGRLGSKNCYEPVNGIRGVARVYDAHVDTRYLKGEPQSRPLNEILKKIKPVKP